MEPHAPLPRRARWTATGALYLLLVLLWLADWESLQPLTGYPHTAADFVALAAAPLFAALLLAPHRWLSVRRRAAIAAAASWAVTLALVALPVRSAAGSWGLPETAALLGLLLGTARRAAPARAAVVLCAALGTAVVAAPLRLRHYGDLVNYAFVLTLAVGAALGLGCYLRALDARRARAVAAVRQGERLELARDLHDFVAHHVTGIVVQAQAARTIRETAPERVDTMLLGIERAGLETLDSMRRLVRVLREEEGRGVRPGELYAALAELAADFARRGGPDVTVRIDAAARRARLAPEVETSVQRAVQEALTNVRRHAPAAATVTVRAALRGGQLTVEVHNGPAAERTAAPAGGRGGFGLVGLRERAEAVGGALTAGPTPEGGWQLTASFPVLDPGPGAGPDAEGGMARSDP
ncbi:sensor histidine kinase [Streptomyces yunnanensis]|uniref:histidine kinase n=1 Tax=Streptomyces yunnanensis TaxID=156453 RepID=A0A9X8N5S6_9ACTN|nr:histidine kinase [Streptomyces yunnanensis]SHN09764.1 Signal transduction histidine kinase [Streptomyces yunnanensis]